ncbi:MAG: phytanoyl-CoA dioxygenase family protein [Arenibacterium sp.]
MKTQQTLREELEENGRAWFRNAISERDLELFDRSTAVASRAGQRIDRSNILVQALSDSSSLLKTVRKLDSNARPVRVVAFNKSGNANWGVPWHQDRVVSVKNKADIAGFGNWTKKSGIWHCEPPQSVLEKMLFVRVHLDDTDYQNGAMEIAVGSHVDGVIPAKRAEATALKYPREYCVAKRGDVLVLKMLTLHCSKPAIDQSRRRVLRIDFASSRLRAPLEWQGFE